MAWRSKQRIAGSRGVVALGVLVSGIVLCVVPGTGCGRSGERRVEAPPPRTTAAADAAAAAAAAAAFP